MNNKLTFAEQIVHQYLCGIQSKDDIETVVQLHVMVHDLTDVCLISECVITNALHSLIDKDLAYSRTDKFGEFFGLTSMRDE